MIKAVFFDLDGTLLPMDEGKFIELYFTLLAKRMMPHGYNANQLKEAVWSATKAMYMNDGSITNEERFWQTFASILGKKALDDKKTFDDFYLDEFKLSKPGTGYNPLAREVVDIVKQKGLKVVLATNPIFPEIATSQRADWAGTPLYLFDFYTVYENSSLCKPNPNYFIWLFNKLNLKPEEVLMVGNNCYEDGIITKLGSKAFIVTDNLINPKNIDINTFPHGDFKALKEYLLKELN